MTKSEINKALREIGVDFVKMRIDYYHEKTHPLKKKGLRAGSIGPLTVTQAHMEHNRNTIDKVKDTLYRLGGSVERTLSDLTVSFPSKKGKLIYDFNLEMFPTYAHNEYDPGYQTYWLTSKTH